uniref:NADH-ubiquinone oxidoreductase chain 5 n=1 Tax=Trigonopterus tanimbarensis TaxID=2678946 RepID=A0A7H1KHS1_9CUCU|nr:NADH dehydrogenase subunit 5 [Trigonopterus tanimbarensis]QNT26837.1 NADH dehydrogenase subunit 5 [Trigonopterus tanimbarensis]
MIVCMFFFFFFFVVSLVLYFVSLFFLYNNIVVLLDFSVLILNSISVDCSVVFDWASLMFASFVFFISCLIILYSSEYMKDDMSIDRFILLVVLFVLSMMVVIFSSSLIFVLLGWDGLGLVSYLLVVYYQNVKSYNAGMLTALSNRIGDAALLLSIMLLSNSGSWIYGEVFDMIKCGTLGKNVYLLGLLIILASMTKSAQIPFSSWLPAAMAAPTPVSSLVHSSTLVTAGVYLLFRFSYLLEPQVSQFFMFLSLLTMFMAGVGANFEFDLKKIIALSTLSQLGMMMVVYYAGQKELAFFHLLMHALFKALLFMCAGVLIHSLGNLQDIRLMGGLVVMFPLTGACFCISSMALCGLPFLSGFYSKDLIAEIFSMNISSILIYLLFYLSIGLTVSYSVRLFIYVFLGRFNLLSLSFLYERESKVMLGCSFIMSLLVIFSGSVLFWMMFLIPCFIILPAVMKVMTLFIILVGVLLGYAISCSSAIQFTNIMSFYQSSVFLSGMWNLSILSVTSLNSLFLFLGKFYIKNMDYGWTEFYGSKGLFSFIKWGANFIQLFSLNHLKVYLLLIWGVLLYLFVFINF